MTAGYQHIAATALKDAADAIDTDCEPNERKPTMSKASKQGLMPADEREAKILAQAAQLSERPASAPRPRGVIEKAIAAREERLSGRSLRAPCL